MLSRALLGTGLLLVGLLTGCSSDPPGEGGPSDPAATMPSDPTSTSASQPTETEPVSPTPTPATGPQITITNFDLPVLRLRLPDDVRWSLRRSGESASSELLATGFVDVDGSTLTVYPGDDLDFYAKITSNNASTVEPRLKRKANRIVDGVDGFVFEGKDQDDFIYIYGAIYGEAGVSVRFKFPVESARFRGWIESALASAEWL